MRKPLLMLILCSSLLPRPAAALFEDLTLTEMLGQLQAMYQLFLEQLDENRRANERLRQIDAEIRKSNEATAPFSDNAADGGGVSLGSPAGSTTDSGPSPAELEAAIAAAQARANAADAAERERLATEIESLRTQLANARRRQKCQSALDRTSGALDPAQREHIVAQCAAVEAINSAVLAQRVLEQQQAEAAEAANRRESMRSAAGQFKAMGGNY